MTQTEKNMDAWSWIYIALFALSFLLVKLLGRFLPLAAAPASLAALILSLLSLPLYIELSVFFALLVSALLVFFFAPRRHETALESMVGKACTVTEEILPFVGGQVEVDGGLWAARAISPEAGHKAGECLVVLAIEGVKVVVG